MKAISLFILTGLFLTSCKPLTGNLIVNKAFNVSETITCDTDWDSFCDDETKISTVKPGQYKAKLDFNSKRSANLKFDKISIAIELPRGQEIPRENGQINISAQDMNQDFDLIGDVATTRSQSDRVSRTEPCTRTEHRQVCHTVHTPNGPRHVCHDQVITIHGYEDVEYYVDYKDTKIILDLNNLSGEKVATFDASRHESNKVYTYRSFCR